MPERVKLSVKKFHWTARSIGRPTTKWGWSGYDIKVGVNVQWHSQHRCSVKQILGATNPE